MGLLNQTLDNLIAFVVVLLTLSLVVQAIQSFVKKIFKLKSRQIEKSLRQLFDEAVSADAPPGAASGMFERTLQKFKGLGRFTLLKNPILDSISKGDLLHVVGKVETGEIAPPGKGVLGPLQLSAKDIAGAVSGLS